MAPTDRDALIIEDDDDIRRLLEIVLTKSGFSVRSASTGSEGLEALAHTRPDLLTVDVGLPDLDGYEVVRRTRREHPTMVVLMVSARSTDADRQAGLASGADAYLTKPFRPRELRAAVDEVLAAKLVGGAPGDGLQRGQG